jgi:hypothetical protein
MKANRKAAGEPMAICDLKLSELKLESEMIFNRFV